MFELNEEIAKWCAMLAGSGKLNKSDINELEGHLREEIEQLTALKLSEDEAFIVARHRLGGTEALSDEFAKVNRAAIFRMRCFWVGVGLLSYELAKHAGLIVSNVGVLLAALFGVRGYLLSVAEVIAQGIFFGVVILVLYLIARMKDIQCGWFSRAAGCALGKVALFGSVFVVIVAMRAGRVFIQMAMVRLLGAREFGELALLQQYKGLVWIVIVPLILLGIIIGLRPEKNPMIEV